MKKLAFFLVMLAAVAVGQAQTTGTGIVLLTGSPYEFTPTTVDSTTTFEFQLVNTVGVQQIVYFGGLDAPFNVNPLIPTAVPANDTLDMELTFNPSEIGVYSDTLEVLGNVFGNADLVISGQGIQVILEWTPEELAFDTTAIGQQSSATLTITSSGDGAGTITDVVFSNPVFSLDEANSSLTIDEGTSGDLTFLFSPTGAGVFNETVELYTNDPNNSIITLPLSAVGISEVSGEVCDATWSLADSPFTLVGDVTVPEGCSLTIEPGVIVQSPGYSIYNHGSLFVIGEIGSEITCEAGILAASSSVFEARHAQFLSDGSAQLTYDDYDVNSHGFEGDVYFENFESESSGVNDHFICYNRAYNGGYYNGTSYNYGCEYTQVNENSTYSSSGSKSFRWYSVVYDADLFLENPIVVDESGVYNLSFGLKTDRREYNHTFRAYYSINGQNPCTSCYSTDNWIEFYEGPYEDNESSELRYIDTDIELEAGDHVNFRFEHDMNNDGWGCADQQITFIDDLRLRKGESPSPIYSNDFGYSGSLNEQLILTELDWTGYNNGNFVNSNTYLEFTGSALHFRCYYQEDWIRTQEFTAPHSGFYVVEYDEYLSDRGSNSYPKMNARRNGGSWYEIYARTVRECYSTFEYYSTWYPRQHTIGWLDEGDTFQLEFNPNISSPPINWHIDNMKVRRLPFNAIPSVTGVDIEESVDLIISDISAAVLSSRSSPDSTIANIEVDNVSFYFSDSEQLQLESSALNSLSVDCVDTLNFMGIDLMCTDGEQLLVKAGYLEFDIEDVYVTGMQSTVAALRLEGSESLEGTLTNIEVESNAGKGVEIRLDNLEPTSFMDVDISHVNINHNSGVGLYLTCPISEGLVEVANSLITDNEGNGINTWVPSKFNYLTIAQNNGAAIQSELDAYESEISNCISSFNNSDFSGSTALEEYNYTGNYPQFQEGSYLLEPYSPCVDAAMPWNTDQNMPFGMGGLRADMGAYGGPNNAGWGGSPAPDGVATLQAASDTPQDQGYVVGLTFDASAFDNSIISDNISHYAVWRHYDPTGESIASLDEGNWELLGTMPAQGFSGYAYQAEALGNTNAFGTFNSCYTVVAHTDNEDVYWYSNVMCGEAIDNLAPEDPELNGLVLESGGAQISWTPPTEDDYAYTEIFNDDGFTAEVGNDTLVVDVSALAGNTYTYTAVHYDVNGNASDPVSLTLDISAGLDVINLNAGWNLISIDRSLSDGDVEELLSGLQPGNLQYVTGFQNGVQFYDPNGLSFLNTLSELDNGYGYWVKVTEDDVLEVGGASLPLNYRPQLTAGWNLIGYPNGDDSDPADYFADLIAEDNLLYVTGFDQGSQVFDPNGLAFLNTLQVLENGFGYWVKTVVGDDPNGMAPANTKSNPAYMVLNGSSQLKDAGGTVDVMNALGEVVATMDILEGGYLMTTAVFGADPSDEVATGLQLGDELSFAYNGKLADQTITWEGGMEHRSLALTFSDVTEALTLSPNPAQATTQLTFELLSDASVNIQVSDATGRLVMDLPLGTLAEGAQQRTLGLSEFDAGVYEVSVVANGAVIGTTRLLKQK